MVETVLWVAALVAVCALVARMLGRQARAHDCGCEKGPSAPDAAPLVQITPRRRAR